jgi:aminodeoxychorismate synthase component I
MPSRVELHSSNPTVAASGWDWQSDRPLATLRCESARRITSLTIDDQSVQGWDDPLAALRWMASDITGDLTARWIGYLSYDLGRLFETLPVHATDDLRLPLFCFSKHRHRDTGLRPVPIAREEKESSTSDATSTGRRPVSQGRTENHEDLPPSSISRTEYLARVARTIEYIRDGDVFQVNLAQRFTQDVPFSADHIWQNLKSRSPAAYGAFLDCGDHTILSNSPELFLHVTPDRRVITRPIKGTRPNQPGMETELQNSLKDRAELNMIVDLERNDLGRICEVGSVRVSQPRTIETHPTVLHGVATIEGQLREKIGFVDLLRATFPGGSITGAPKIRAMEIIDELEPVRRGVYCGAIGYLAGDGSMQFNVAIRTMTAIAGKIHIPVGGGIVADSVPNDEYEETLVKARAMFAALKA